MKAMLLRTTALNGTLAFYRVLVKTPATDERRFTYQDTAASPHLVFPPAEAAIEIASRVEGRYMGPTH